ncbi:MAG TPA: hypothetical protein ENF93_00745 [Ignisphaera sp.]|nr:hypothetical protein [Ignisphaera sp.]
MVVVVYWGYPTPYTIYYPPYYPYYIDPFTMMYVAMQWMWYPYYLALNIELYRLTIDMVRKSIEMLTKSLEYVSKPSIESK